MLSPERHTRILQALTESPAVRVADLAATLGVSDMTIRRDIDLLDEKHLLKKIHGGASRLDVLSSIEPASPIRRISNCGQNGILPLGLAS